MQSHGYGIPPQRQQPPWGWIIGGCCGGCAVLVILFAIGAAMITKSAIKDARVGVPAPQEFNGTWQGQDSSVLSIHSGTGDYKGGGTTMTGGPARYEPDKQILHLRLLGMGKDFHVDVQPHETSGGAEMTLSGIAYRRSGAFTSDKSVGGADNSASASTSTGDAPTESEANEMAQKSVLDWNDGVQSKDFTGFHSHVSDQLQKDAPPDKMLAAFQQFIDKKVDISSIKNVAPTYDEPPNVKPGGILSLTGTYLISPKAVHFVLTYVKQNDEWKLFGIKVNVK